MVPPKEIADQQLINPLKEIFESSSGATVWKHESKDQTYTVSSDGHLSKKHRSFLDLAAKVALESDVTSHMHGAVIVKGGRVLALASNRWRNESLVYTSSPNSSEYNEHLTVHAEVAAIARAKNPRGATIYIARLAKSADGSTRFSRPCVRCYAALVEAGIRTVVYTCD